jgi:hypothetical protein
LESPGVVGLPARQAHVQATSSTNASHPDPQGGFTVLDSQQRRLDRHAHAQGYSDSDLASYLRARSQQQASPAQLASDLGTTTTVRDRLDQHGLPAGGRASGPAGRSSGRPPAERPNGRPAWPAWGFADVEDYLRGCGGPGRAGRFGVLAELLVGSAWLKDQMDQLHIP